MIPMGAAPPRAPSERIAPLPVVLHPQARDVIAWAWSDSGCPFGLRGEDAK